MTRIRLVDRKKGAKGAKGGGRKIRLVDKKIRLKRRPFKKTNPRARLAQRKALKRKIA